MDFFYELTNSVVPESEDLSPHSQQPANGPCPEPGESNPHPLLANLHKIFYELEWENIVILL
jgi:hypothetical protein